MKLAFGFQSDHVLASELIIVGHIKYIITDQNLIVYALMLVSNSKHLISITADGQNGLLESQLIDVLLLFGSFLRK